MLKIRTMATNFSPCKGSYVLNQFPSNVMFGMNGFHVSASGAIQGHHGPVAVGKGEIACYKQFLLFPQFFQPIWKTFCHFHYLLNCRLQAFSVWKSLNICRLGKS